MRSIDLRLTLGGSNYAHFPLCITKQMARCYRSKESYISLSFFVNHYQGCKQWRQTEGLVRELTVQYLKNKSQ
jgi:hypothetical protein